MHKKCLAIDIGLPNLEKNEEIMTGHIPCLENKRSKLGIHLDCESKLGGPIAQVIKCAIQFIVESVASTDHNALSFVFFGKLLFFKFLTSIL